jgi:hypothetical protein
VLAIAAWLAPLSAQVPIGFGGGFVPAEIFVNDGATRIQMKWLPAASSMNMAAAMVPFRRIRPYFYIEGEKASLRTSNVAPTFDLGIPSDVHAEQLVTLVRLKSTRGQRRIEMRPTGMRQPGRATFDDDDVVPVSIAPLTPEGEHQPPATSARLTPHRVTLKGQLKPGEYALFAGMRFYDFAVD